MPTVFVSYFRLFVLITFKCIAFLLSMCYIITMMNENNVEQTQLKVWVPLELKKEFQMHCIRTNTNMTSTIVELLQMYLEKNKAIA